MSAPQRPRLASSPEQRKHPRKDVIANQLVSVDVNAQQASAIILDASEGGMAIQMVKPLRSRSKGSLTFLPPDTTDRLWLTGIPVWSIGNRVGIRFTDLDDASRASLTAWLASLPPEKPSGPQALPRERHLPQDAPHAPVQPHVEHHPDSSNSRSAPSNALGSVTRGELVPPGTPSQESLDSVASRARMLLCGTGAAVAWGASEHMVCRASDGDAPPRGVPVDIARGLSGECVRTLTVVRCDDTELDPRVDPDVCRQLHLRSAIIVPIVGPSGIFGLIEVFSNKARAFSEADVPTLQTLAGQFDRPTDANAVPRAANSASVSPFEKRPAPMPEAEAAQQPRSAVSKPAAAPKPLTSSTAVQQRKPSQVESLRRHLSTSAASVQTKRNPKFIIATLIIIGGVLAGSIYLAGTGISAWKAKARTPGMSTPAAGSRNNVSPDQAQAQQLGPSDTSQRRSQRKHSSSTQSSDARTNTVGVGSESVPPVAEISNPQVSGPQTPPPAIDVSAVAPNRESGLLAALPSGADTPAFSPGTVPSPPSPEANVSRVSDLKLVRQVPPKYPRAALLTRKEGTVTLRLNVGSDGRVKDAQLLSGDDAFARAALDAVREWRYRPYMLNGKPIEASTDAIITFSLTAKSHQ